MIERRCEIGEAFTLKIRDLVHLFHFVSFDKCLSHHYIRFLTCLYMQDARSADSNVTMNNYEEWLAHWNIIRPLKPLSISDILVLAKEDMTFRKEPVGFHCHCHKVWKGSVHGRVVTVHSDREFSLPHGSESWKVRNYESVSRT